MCLPFLKNISKTERSKTRGSGKGIFIAFVDVAHLLFPNCPLHILPLHTNPFPAYANMSGCQLFETWGGGRKRLQSSSWVSVSEELTSMLSILICHGVFSENSYKGPRKSRHAAQARLPISALPAKRMAHATDIVRTCSSETLQGAPPSG